jgi:hypothetical protein
MTDFAALAPTFTAFAVELADAARRLQAELSTEALDVEVKPDRSFATALDTRIEAHLRAMTRQRWPGHGIIGEEEDWVDSDAEHVWVLDPIDGTAAFKCGLYDAARQRPGVFVTVYIPRNPHGTLCDERLTWLDACLTVWPERPTLVFMHHPPSKPASVTWTCRTCSTPMLWPACSRAIRRSDTWPAAMCTVPPKQ